MTEKQLKMTLEEADLIYNRALHVFGGSCTNEYDKCQRYFRSFRQLFEIHMYMCEIASHEQDILLSELVEKEDDDISFSIDNLVTLKLGKIFGEGIWFDFESEDLRKNHDTWIWTIE